MLYNMIKCFLSFIVTIEGNVYSEAYLGKLLSLAGKLYFAQIDIADIMAADVYDVSSVRTLSEGITGYEAKTASLYGVVTGLSEGNLYIDIDTDSHNVISLTGEEDAPREYMLATGMLSSAYEGIVWEQLTGYKGVSTISIFAQAKEENMDILLISQDNLSTEIEKLNTDETTKQNVKNAVNSGMTVAIPAENVTIYDWSGTGYIITNPETGAGAYMISGGANGGILPFVVSMAVVCGSVASIAATGMLILSAVMFLAPIITPLIFVAGPILLASILVIVVELNRKMFTFYEDYVLTGNLESAEAAAVMGGFLGDLSTMMIDLVCLLGKYVHLPWFDETPPSGGNEPGGDDSPNDGDSDGGNSPGGDGDSDGGNSPDGDGDSDGGNKPDGDGDSDGGNSSDGDGDGDGTSDGNGDGDNTSDGDDGDGNKSDGDTDNGNSSSGKGDADDGSSTGNKGDTDGGGTSGGSGDIDDGGSSGGTGTDDGGSSTGGDSGTSGDKTSVPNKGFSSFGDLKKHLGSPGEGNAWHHIVEQSQIGKRANFAAEQVHNVNNIIAIPSGSGSIHSKISAHYSSKFDFTNGLTVRDWLAGKSFDEQFEYGKKLLEEYGEVIATENGWIFKVYE